jgi:hypothetical protein
MVALSTLSSPSFNGREQEQRMQAQRSGLQIDLLLPVSIGRRLLNPTILGLT